MLWIGNHVTSVKSLLKIWSVFAIKKCIHNIQIIMSYGVCYSIIHISKLKLFSHKNEWIKMNIDNLQKEKEYNKINKYRYKMDMDIIL